MSLVVATCRNSTKGMDGDVTMSPVVSKLSHEFQRKSVTHQEFRVPTQEDSFTIFLATAIRFEVDLLHISKIMYCPLFTGLPLFLSFLSQPLVSTRRHFKTSPFEFGTKMPPNQQSLRGLLPLGIGLESYNNSEQDIGIIRCAILGNGMMGREHISYIAGYEDLRIDFLCDPHKPSIEESIVVMKEFNTKPSVVQNIKILQDEEELLKHASEIDLLVIATPNYLHTGSIMKWGLHDLTILVEKPVAVSQEQHDMLKEYSLQPDFIARVWVAMEYRYIPAISKLLSLVPKIGDIKMVTIRENRYPFLHKIGAWNRYSSKTGDTLVEKCCHFFDLFRLITRQEVSNQEVRAMAQRGLNYQDEVLSISEHDKPIIDSAYVFMPFEDQEESDDTTTTLEGDQTKPTHHSTPATLGCLELCMFSEGSRHQEEVIVTGTKGRLEAYLPENKVFYFQRPCNTLWKDRSLPPPEGSIKGEVFDCSNVKAVHGIEEDFKMPTHGGYHYCSTAVEWYNVISAMKKWKATGHWEPHVTLEDGMKAVQIGLAATDSVANSGGNRDCFTRSISSPIS